MTIVILIGLFLIIKFAIIPHIKEFFKGDIHIPKFLDKPEQPMCIRDGNIADCGVPEKGEKIPEVDDKKSEKFGLYADYFQGKNETKIHKNLDEYKKEFL